MKTTDFASISSDELVDVTGGGAMGNAWNWVKKNAGSIAEGIGGLMSGEQGTNIGMQNGSNQRSAQGNTGPVSMGDGSPITTGQ